MEKMLLNTFHSVESITGRKAVKTSTTCIYSLFQVLERIKLSHYLTQGKNMETTRKVKVLHFIVI